MLLSKIKKIMHYNKNDTITAISTPIGEGAISIIRLSGKNAINIANKIFSKNVKTFKSHTAHFGKILDLKKNVIDTAILIVYLSPNSFTGEDVVEIQCHGGRLITQKVFETTLKAKARAAHPGEFTMRAFLNKKIDLIQAEAISELISAKNNYALECAKNHLEGLLSKEIKNIQKKLLEIAGIIEASLDFPEEDLDQIATDDLLNKLNTILKDLQKLSLSFEDGKIIKDGKSICIIGSPNVGKSYLMNTLLKKDRAIVTEIPGTTRDILEDDIKINQMNYRLFDTAGIRKTKCKIEKEGINRSKKVASSSDIVILVLDASRGLNSEDKYLLKKVKKNNTIIAWNKLDICRPKERINFCQNNVLEISAKTSKGFDSLYKAIEKLTFISKISNEQIVITKKRHKIALDEAIFYIKKTISSFLKKIPLEIIAIDIKSSLNALSKIIGFDITEEILTSIFSNFCIGK